MHPFPCTVTWSNPQQLFYILIAVLGAFAIVSSGNLIRSRRRRRIVIREATRLGLMVPGMPGYVPMRERPAFVKADGWRTPDWWEVEPEKQSEEVESGASDAVALGQTPGPSLSQTTAPENEYGARGQLELPDLDDLVSLDHCDLRAAVAIMPGAYSVLALTRSNHSHSSPNQWLSIFRKNHGLPSRISQTTCRISVQRWNHENRDLPQKIRRRSSVSRVRRCRWLWRSVCPLVTDHDRQLRLQRKRTMRLSWSGVV